MSSGPERAVDARSGVATRSYTALENFGQVPLDSDESQANSKFAVSWRWQQAATPPVIVAPRRVPVRVPPAISGGSVSVTPPVPALPSGSLARPPTPIRKDISLAHSARRMSFDRSASPTPLAELGFSKIVPPTSSGNHLLPPGGVWPLSMSGGHGEGYFSQAQRSPRNVSPMVRHGSPMARSTGPSPRAPARSDGRVDLLPAQGGLVFLSGKPPTIFDRGAEGLGYSEDLRARMLSYTSAANLLVRQATPLTQSAATLPGRGESGVLLSSGSVVVPNIRPPAVDSSADTLSEAAAFAKTRAGTLTPVLQPPPAAQVVAATPRMAKVLGVSAEVTAAAPRRLQEETSAIVPPKAEKAPTSALKSSRSTAPASARSVRLGVATTITSGSLHEEVPAHRSQSVPRERKDTAAIFGTCDIEMPGAEQVIPTGPGAGAINIINSFLRDTGALRSRCKSCVMQVAGDITTLDVNQLRQFRQLLEVELGLEEEAAFGNVEDSFVLFDFDGNGSLEPHEVYMLVKFHLREYRKKLGGHPQASVPFSSLAEKGYRVLRSLGAGSQGKAELGINAHGKQVCIKSYSKSRKVTDAIDKVKEELESISFLKDCPHIANCYELFQDSQFFYMIGDPYMGGDFETLRQRCATQNVVTTEDWWRGLVRQCFLALEYMHGKALMHCDIKEPNIMVQTNDMQNPHIVLIDLGLATVVTGKEKGFPVGTPGYIPPETWDNNKWYPRGDIFSMGVTLLQVIIGRVPDARGFMVGIFQELPYPPANPYAMMQMVAQITRTKAPPLHLMPKELSGLAQILSQCLEKDRNRRPRAPQALAFPWLSGGSSLPSTASNALLAGNAISAPLNARVIRVG